MTQHHTFFGTGTRGTDAGYIKEKEGPVNTNKGFASVLKSCGMKSFLIDAVRNSMKSWKKKSQKKAAKKAATLAEEQLTWDVELKYRKECTEWKKWMHETQNSMVPYSLDKFDLGVNTPHYDAPLGIWYKDPDFYRITYRKMQVARIQKYEKSLFQEELVPPHVVEGYNTLLRLAKRIEFLTARDARILQHWTFRNEDYYIWLCEKYIAKAKAEIVERKKQEEQEALENEEAQKKAEELKATMAREDAEFKEFLRQEDLERANKQLSLF